MLTLFFGGQTVLKQSTLTEVYQNIDRSRRILIETQRVKLRFLHLCTFPKR